VRRLAGVPILLAAACTVAKGPVPPASKPTTAGAPPAIRYEQHIAVEGNEPPATDMTNPYTGDAKSAEEGGKLFTSMNCDGCHGGGATGFMGPSLSDGRWKYGGSDGAVFHSIYYGRPMGMPAFGGTLQPVIVWKLVTYLRSLPVPAAVPTQSWP
jgi:cytochrome c oxidase cbb3-type subunit 3